MLDSLEFMNASEINISILSFNRSFPKSPATPCLTCARFDLFKINGARHGSVPPHKKKKYA